MTSLHSFSFERSRGVVWVCDLAGSSRFLNDNNLAAHLEEFLPRLHWIGMTAVAAAGGHFVKWTGDGFLAWFHTPLYRDLGRQATAALEALWHLSFCVNVTQLGVTSPRKFRLQHGITYEQDALVTRITLDGSPDVFDITGRGVVLAFRLSGIPSPFPGYVAQTEATRAAREHGYDMVRFKTWRPTNEARLKYFKGETWGTKSLCQSTDGPPRRKRRSLGVRLTHRTLGGPDSGGTQDPLRPDLSDTLRPLRPLPP